MKLGVLDFMSFEWCRAYNRGFCINTLAKGKDSTKRWATRCYRTEVMIDASLPYLLGDNGYRRGSTVDEGSTENEFKILSCQIISGDASECF